MGNIVIPVMLVVVVGIIASVLLVIASKVFFVKVDERVAEVRSALPGANCGACGFAGCDDYAAAVTEDESVPCTKCSVGGESAAEAISKILGRDAGGADRQVAFVRCNGDNGASKKTLEWQGLMSCAAAKTFYNGVSACSHGCIGFGDCVNVCEFDSIGVVNGVAKVNRDTCVACGKCIKECPQGLIALFPYKQDVHVVCQNTEKGGVTRKQCSNGCIGCGKCVKVCRKEAITVEDNLARIDPEKCINCGLCVTVCPTGAINSFNPRHAKMVINAKKKAEAEKKAKLEAAKASKVEKEATKA